MEEHRIIVSAHGLEMTEARELRARIDGLSSKITERNRSRAREILKTERIAALKSRAVAAGMIGKEP